MNGSGTSGNVVLGNLIGTDINGTAKLGNGADGLLINGATANTVGGAAPGAGNVISGNTSDGVHLIDTSENVVLGNLIGTDVHGTANLGNTSAGVYMFSDATANTVGGTASGAGNVISGNQYGVYLLGAGTSGNVVLGNLIGTDIHGAAALGNRPGGGVFLRAQATSNTVGGTASGAANVISGNQAGVEIIDAGTSGNVVLGNLIGTDVHGTAALGNTAGVQINLSAGSNTVGGTASGAGNVISGNLYGVFLNKTSGNVVLGNLIGTDVHGAAKLGNTNTGVLIQGGATANTVGGLVSSAANVISGNSGVGVNLSGASANVVLGNLIGTDINGIASLGNTDDGVLIGSTATSNTVGGAATGAGNVISANATGVELAGHITSNTVVGNLIGTSIGASAALGNTIGLLLDASGDTITANTAAGQNTIEANHVAIELNTTAASNVVLGLNIGTNAAGAAALPLPNMIGLLILGANNTVGGVSSGSSNVISGNIQAGLQIQDTSASGNLVMGNFIGTDVNGAAKLDNGVGVVIGDSATANTIGGAVSAGNVLSSNGGDGVYIGGSGTSGNVVLGNKIGTDKNGAASLGNGTGLVIEAGATANTIGGTVAAAANVISGNVGTGVSLYNSGTSGNVVLGNLIGTDKNGTANLGNFYGVYIDFSATANTIGGTASGAGNVISGNYHGGVYLTYSGTSGNVVLGNLIGTDVHGTAALGNGGQGVWINDGATANSIGGTAAGAKNLISGNANNGVYIAGSGTSGNVVLGNLIGTDKTGTIGLGNADNGVSIVLGAAGNTIGGTASGAGNVISGNSDGGIDLSDAGVSGNVVLGNLIGTDKTGVVALGNAGLRRDHCQPGHE